MAAEKGTKIWVLLASAIGFGIVAALFSALYLKSREEAIRQRLEGERQQMVNVVVAQADMPKGTRVSHGSFAIRQIPAEFVHNDAIFPEYFDSIQERFLAVPLAAGKPLLDSFLVKEFPRDFSDTLPEGQRAITISIDDEGSHAAMLRPGNRIDLFVNIPTRESGYLPKPPDGGTVAANYLPPEWMQITERVMKVPPTDIVMPVVQDVKVLATGRDPYNENLDSLNLPQLREEHRYSTITIAVTAKQASLIRTAEDKGELLAFLRNREDRSYADFVGVTPQDLFGLAMEMAAEAQLREAAAEAGATIDDDGNWVTADGRVIPKEDVVVGPDGTVRTRDGKLIAAPGLKMDENGQFVDANGNVLAPEHIAVQAPDGTFVDANGKPIPPENLVVGPDGTVQTREQQLAALGYTRNEKGELVDKDGNVVRPEDVVMQTADGRFVDANGNEIPADQLLVAADGTVRTRDAVLAEAGLTMNADGDYVDADGNVIKKDDLVVLADGTVMTKDGKVLSKAKAIADAGLTVNANGDYVDAQGNVIKKEDLVVLDDGTVQTKDGRVLAGPAVKVNEQGFIVAADGTVMSRDGKILNGLTVDENGNVVGPDGTKYRADELVIGADGKVTLKDGTLIAGVSAATPGSTLIEPRVTAFAEAAEALGVGGGRFIQLIVGGGSTDGVAKITTLPITD